MQGEMTRYLISFDHGAMDPIPDAEGPAVRDASLAVIQDFKDAGIWVFAGGVYPHDEVSASVVAPDGTVTDGAENNIAGVTIIDVPHARRRCNGPLNSPSPAAVHKRSASSRPTRPWVTDRRASARSARCLTLPVSPSGSGTKAGRGAAEPQRRLPRAPQFLPAIGGWVRPGAEARCGAHPLPRGRHLLPMPADRRSPRHGSGDTSRHNHPDSTDRRTTPGSRDAPSTRHATRNEHTRTTIPLHYPRPDPPPLRRLPESQLRPRVLASVHLLATRRLTLRTPSPTITRHRPATPDTELQKRHEPP